MAVTPNSHILPQAIAALGQVEFTDANGTTEQTVFTAGANGAIVPYINIATTDTAARKVYFRRTTGKTDWIVNVPLQAGTKSDATVPSVSGLNRTQNPSLTLDQNGNPVMLLGPSETIIVVLDANCSAGLKLWVSVIGLNL
jgi:hypothetical protein